MIPVAWLQLKKERLRLLVAMAGVGFAVMLVFMARLARVVVPGLPHHVTQRGNRRQQTFFDDEDYQAYKDLVSKYCGESGVSARSSSVRR